MKNISTTIAKTKAGNEPYCPDAGEIIWIQFNPTVGREQAERRPALVLSPRGYNARSGLCVLCPITSRAARFPFDVPIPDGQVVVGTVLADQVKSLSWQGRGSIHAGLMTERVVAETRAKIKALAGIP